MQLDTATLLGLAAGLGLAAACGFRVFMPLLVASLAVRAGLLRVDDGFQWLGSTPALVGFATATAAEIAGYYVPLVDNLLDAIATPAAVLAGTLLCSAVFVDMDPWLRWSLAAIAGGGVAAAVQASTVVLRGASTATTAGTANPLVASGELAGSAAFSTASVFAPWLALALLAGVGVWFLARLRRRRARAA